MKLKFVPEEYQTKDFLENSPWICVTNLYQLPYQQKFIYSKRCEYEIADLVMEEFGGEVVSLTDGFDPGYDLIVRMPDNSPFYKQELFIEVKYTSLSRAVIELGRLDGTQSGLSATKAHFYLLISPMNEAVDIGKFVLNGKVRLVSPHKLDTLHRAHKEQIYGNSALGPGSYGLKLSEAEMLSLAWVGDIAARVDQYENTLYNLQRFKRTAINKHKTIGILDRELDAMYKMDPNFKGQQRNQPNE